VVVAAAGAAGGVAVDFDLDDFDDFDFDEEPFPLDEELFAFELLVDIGFAAGAMVPDEAGAGAAAAGAAGAAAGVSAAIAPAARPRVNKAAVSRVPDLFIIYLSDGCVRPGPRIRGVRTIPPRLRSFHIRVRRPYCGHGGRSAAE
jgi:hypothetical protein